MKRGIISNKFWEQADNSRLASSELYKEQRRVISTYILPYLKANNRLLDIGCSDGEFTALLARDSRFALGIDFSEELIHQATKWYENEEHLHFKVANITELDLTEKVDVVACMGLFTRLVRNEDFEETIENIMRVLSLGGYLVLKDSVMLAGEDEVYFNNGKYEAIYREESDYLKAFTDHGLEVVERHVLSEKKGQVNQTNLLYLLHRPPPRYYSFPEKKLNQTRIAILYQMPESWANVRSVWEAAKQRQDVEIYVVLLPFFHSLLEWNRGKVERLLQDEGIEYLAWDQFKLEESGFDVVLYTSPYDSSRPELYRFDTLQTMVPVTAYIPYGLEVGGGLQNVIYQYAQPVTTHATAVFVRSEGVKQNFITHCPSGADHVVVTGHPRMDGLINLQAFSPDPALLAEIGDRKAILWNAHFSFDDDKWSTFDYFFADIVSIAYEQPDLALIFRPHPLLWKKLLDLKIFTPVELDEFKQELQSLGVIIDERIDHRHAFAASRALMTDAGSFLMEYFVTGKPVLYLCNRKGLGLNQQGEAVVKYYQIADCPEQIADFVNQVVKGGGYNAKARQKFISKFFDGFDGASGKRVVQHLVDLSKQT